MGEANGVNGESRNLLGHELRDLYIFSIDPKKDLVWMVPTDNITLHANPEGIIIAESMKEGKFIVAGNKIPVSSTEPKPFNSGKPFLRTYVDELMELSELGMNFHYPDKWLGPESSPINLSAVPYGSLGTVVDRGVLTKQAISGFNLADVNEQMLLTGLNEYQRKLSPNGHLIFQTDNRLLQMESSKFKSLLKQSGFNFIEHYGRLKDEFMLPLEREGKQLYIRSGAGMNKFPDLYIASNVMNHY